VFVSSAIVEVRGGHAARELVFCVTLSTSTSNHHQQFTGLEGAAWRGAGLYYNRRGRGRGHGRDGETDAFTDLHSSFPFRSIFSAHFFSALSAPPSSPPP